MKFDYDEIREIVNEIIPEFGIACTAVFEVVGDYDPEFGVTTNRHETKGRAVMANFKLRPGDQNNLIEIGDKLLLATSSLELKVGSIVNVESEDWQVIDPSPIQPASTVVLYKAHVRRV